MPTKSEGSESAVPHVAQTKDAAKRMREASRWQATASAAVGVALVSGLQLTDLAKITPWSRWVCLVAVLVALAGVALVIAATTYVLSTPYITLGQLAHDPKLSCLRDEVKGDLIITDEHARTGDVQEYEGWYRERVARQFDLRRRHDESTDEAEKSWLAAKHAQVVRTLTFANQINEKATAKANFSYLQFRYGEAQRRSLFGFLLAVAGVLTFAVAAADGRAKHSDAPTDLEAVGLRLTREFATLIKAELGQACVPADDLHVIQLKRTAAGAEVVTIPAAGCERSLRFFVPQGDGVVVQKIPQK